MFKSSVNVSKDINCLKIIEFMKRCKENKTDVHSFEIIQNGEVKVKIAPAPYSFEYKQQLYSLSKSFSSTAIGFLVDDGVIDVNDRVVDIFGDKCPENIGENLSRMRLCHLLSMNTGHSRCLLNDIRRDEDPIKSFLMFEPEFEPGTHFFYNNAATFMLSEIVRKYTDMSMYDFLEQRLFVSLGINGTYWNAFADGNSQGAVGLHASTDDVAKLGLLYLNKGVYNGKRILSENWVETATKAWSDNSMNGTPDWVAGYGFQFWRNARDGFRGDGAFGQLCMVFPSKNMVFAMEAYSEDMQEEINRVYELADNLCGDSNVTVDELCAFADKYNAPCEYSAGKITNRLYRCNENRFGMTFIGLSEEDECIKLNFSDGTKWQTMKFGKGRFIENNIRIRKFKPTLEELAGHNEKENVRFAAYCTFKNDGLHLYFNYLDNPHTDEYICGFDEHSFELKKIKDAEFSYHGEVLGECLDKKE